MGMNEIRLELPQELMQGTDGSAVPSALHGDGVIGQMERPREVSKRIRFAEAINPLFH